MENWFDEFDGAITVCDREGIILYMNKTAVAQFEKYGGAALIGKNLLDCHPEPSRSKLKEMLKAPQSNTYSIEKRGLKKIIHQTPFYREGIFSGVIELSFPLPDPMPHRLRD